MVMTSKRRAVISYENMSDELAAAFAEKYLRPSLKMLTLSPYSGKRVRFP